MGDGICSSSQWSINLFPQFWLQLKVGLWDATSGNNITSDWVRPSALTLLTRAMVPSSPSCSIPTHCCRIPLPTLLYSVSPLCRISNVNTKTLLWEWLSLLFFHWLSLIKISVSFPYSTILESTFWDSYTDDCLKMLPTILLLVSLQFVGFAMQKLLVLVEFHLSIFIFSFACFPSLI